MTIQESKKVIRAINGSVEKWADIILDKKKDMGCDNCPLCGVFMKTEGGETSCGSCPVKEESGEALCQATPYQKWTSHHEAYHAEVKDGAQGIECPICAKLALEEWDYLCCLKHKYNEKTAKLRGEKLHLPEGEWYVEDAGSSPAVKVKTVDGQIITLLQAYKVGIYAGQYEPRDICEFVAAAPEMWELLKETIHRWGICHNSSEDLKKYQDVYHKFSMFMIEKRLP